MDIYGTHGNDTLTGTDPRDDIVGRAGTDIPSSLDGNDDIAVLVFFWPGTEEHPVVLCAMAGRQLDAVDAIADNLHYSAWGYPMAHGLAAVPVTDLPPHTESSVKAIRLDYRFETTLLPAARDGLVSQLRTDTTVGN